MITDHQFCQFLNRSHCNSPAEFQEPGRLRYCRMHAEAVELAMKRSGKRIALIKFP